MHPTEPIASVHNPRFRAALGLREARARRASGLILVDGAREIGRALAAGIAGRELWVAHELVRSEDAEAALAAAAVRGVRIVPATASLMGKLAFGDRQDGLVLVAEAPATDLGRLDPPANALIGVVEGVEKPGNLGAIARSADGAGLDALIVADPRADPWNPNAIRAGMGTLFSLPIAVCTADEALAWLRARPMRIVATRVDGSAPYTEADLTPPVAIVLGSEADGLTAAWTGSDITAVRIPMRGIADSLNVSVSAAILFYEAARRRG